MKSPKNNRHRNFTFARCFAAILAGIAYFTAAHTVHSQEKKMHAKNHLQSEQSPYLLQHAANPVDWYPWGEEAFQKAKKEDKPIFLSIGYHTCHWCHVMERESFENAKVAEILNKSFIAIKVDREERPDIDKVYMTACQMMTGSGGWPLTIIMTPEKKPFFAGTYFPRESRGGRIGLIPLLEKIAVDWRGNRAKIQKWATTLSQRINMAVNDGTASTALPADTPKRAFEELNRRFDAKFAGFGGSPKFPMFHTLIFLMRYWQWTGEAKALEMATKTLDRMRNGGIFDQVGFGFHRYSTDGEWLVPHFEKMLYDQALALMAYTEAYQATGNMKYANVAKEIIAYLARDLTSKEGAFFTAEDADSEGVEGKFYTWTVGDLSKTLSGDDLALAKKYFKIKTGGNFKDEATGVATGANILHLRLNAKPARGKDIERIRKNLLATRSKRIRPSRDGKILLDWNSLMIAALAKAGRALNDKDATAAAVKAANFAISKMIAKDGSARHRYMNGSAGIRAKLDDYAFAILAMLELYETTFDVKYLKVAMKMTKHVSKHFLDKKHGGYFMTSDDDESLIARPKEIYDGAVPSGNSIMMLNLQKITALTGDAKFANAADVAEKAFSKSILRSPSSHSMAMCALIFEAYPPYEIVVVYKSDDIKGRDAMLNAIRGIYFPNKVVIARPTTSDGKTPPICEFAKFAEPQLPISGAATAYICKKFACLAPTTSPEKAAEILRDSVKR
ncbi:MAG: thioredoxin domain-containing protein [Victivallales bacterium]|nr:thioredoxin domain-containing protein [Victivallales bacterium]